MTVTVTATPSSSAAGASGPGFPTIEALAAGKDSNLGEDEPDYYQYVLLEHAAGPCILTADFVWETVDSTGAAASATIRPVADGRVRYEYTLREWCIHTKAGVSVPEGASEGYPLDRLRAYRKATGEQVLDLDLPPPPEDAAFTASSPVARQIHVTMIKGGPRQPYDTTTGTSSENGAYIFLDGVRCANPGDYDPAGLGTDGKWNAGETVILPGPCNGTHGGPAFVSNASHAIRVEVRGVTAFEGTVIVR